MQQEQQSALDDKIEEILRWLALSQEMYIIRNDGEIKYLPFEVYSQKENLVEWWYGNKEDEHHLCFVTPNGYQPLNLQGPIVTKVIPWNIKTAKPPKDRHGAPLKPGYFIDLRGLHMGRLAFGTPQMELMREALKVQLIETENNRPAYDGRVPEEAMYELENKQPENLYIASWRCPLTAHSLDKLEEYQVHYVPLSLLDECESVDKVDDRGVGIEGWLREYFELTGVQTGRLNPLDVVDLAEISEPEHRLNPDDPNTLFYITCYVANLKTLTHKN